MSCQDNWQYLGYTYTITPHYVSSHGRSSGKTIYEHPLSVEITKPVWHIHKLADSQNAPKFCEEGYASEQDIIKFISLLHKITANLIENAITDSCDPYIDAEQYNRRYNPFFSKLLMTAKIGHTQDTMSDIIKNLGKTDGRYSITYDDDGWYKITPYNTRNPIMLKVVYVGKNLTPAIVGIKYNDAYLDFSLTDKELHESPLLMEPYDPNYLYMSFLCRQIYYYCKDNAIVRHSDINDFLHIVNNAKLTFVQQFYRDLVKIGTTSRTIRKEYKKSMCLNLFETLKQMAKSDRSNPNAAAQLFWPADLTTTHGADYQITYLGNDWYQITLPDSSSLQLKVVLYGPKLTPAIMGIKNPYVDTYYCPKRFANN